MTSDKRNIIYISGQMTGRPDDARPEFAAAAERLEAAGYSVRNPHDHPVRETWCEYMRQDIEFIASPACGDVALIDGWEKSPGSQVEVLVAQVCGLPIGTIGAWLIGRLDPSVAMPSNAVRERCRRLLCPVTEGGSVCPA